MQGQVADTPKPGDAIFARATNVIIGSNLLAAQAALEEAKNSGFNPLLLTTSLQGEARQAGRFLAALARQIAASGQPVSRPACLVAGGETTVTLHGDGLGGRNQELALGAVADLAGLKDILLVSLATDGGDGPTDAAGAVVSGATLQRARQAGLQVGDFLDRNDAYHFFAALEDLLKPGPTMTNVNDLTFIFAF
jgi:hydroxypyruvate reductase